MEDHSENGSTVPSEPRSFIESGADVELKPIRNPEKATAPAVARGVNQLHKCVEQGFKDVQAELGVIRQALHIDEHGKRIGGSPIGMLSTVQAGWRGALIVFAGLSATIFVWRGLFELWPSISTFGMSVFHWINTGRP